MPPEDSSPSLIRPPFAPDRSVLRPQCPEKTAPRSTPLGLLHFDPTFRILLSPTTLSAISLTKKGPERLTFSPYLLFYYVPFSASSAFSSVNLSPTCGKELLATAGGQRCCEYGTTERAETAESSHLPFPPPAGRLPYALCVHLRSSAFSAVTLPRVVRRARVRLFPSALSAVPNPLGRSGWIYLAWGAQLALEIGAKPGCVPVCPLVEKILEFAGISASFLGLNRASVSNSGAAGCARRNDTFSSGESAFCSRFGNRIEERPAAIASAANVRRRRSEGNIPRLQSPFARSARNGLRSPTSMGKVQNICHPNATVRSTRNAQQIGEEGK